MRGKTPIEQLLFDPEIEKTARKNNSKTRKRKQLAKQRQQQKESSTSNSTSSEAQEEPMAAPGAAFAHNSPRYLTRLARTGNQEGAKTTEMKTGLLQLLYANPYAGLDHEDPYAHLIKFYELCGTLGATEQEEESNFLRLFPFSLIGKAKDWFLDQPQTTLSNRNQLEEKFMARYFPQSRLMDAKTAISVFTQAANETLCEAWERNKSLLRRCPNHGFDEQTQVHMFLNGLLQQPKLLLDATAGGSLMAKSPIEAIQIIDSMATNDH